MPIYRQGNMWSVFDEVDHFVITTNSFIKNNGAVVMGAGIAKQVRDTYPGIDQVIGAAIQHMGTYNVIIGGKIGVFQVKYHFKDAADLALITASTAALASIATSNPAKIYALNFPGIGNGKLSYNSVKPVVDLLPDNVQIWTFLP